MKRTTVFLTEDLDLQLQEVALRTQRAHAAIIREALSTYLAAQRRPWPQSIGAGDNVDPTIDSSNVKDWIHGEWDQSTKDSG